MPAAGKDTVSSVRLEQAKAGCSHQNDVRARVHTLRDSVPRKLQQRLILGLLYLNNTHKPWQLGPLYIAHRHVYQTFILYDNPIYVKQESLIQSTSIQRALLCNQRVFYSGCRQVQSTDVDEKDLLYNERFLILPKRLLYQSSTV